MLITMPPMVESLMDRMFRSIERDPRYLLMEDGGPVGRKAHVIIARLYGHDDRIEHEWRVREVVPSLLVSSSTAAPLQSAPDPDPYSPAFGAVEYVLQSGFATAALAASVADAETTRWIGEDPNSGSFDWDFLAVRYARRALR